MSSDDEDLAKLMREIDAMTGPSQPTAKPPATNPPPASKEVAERRSPRGRWALICAVGAGIVGFVVGSLLWFLPGVNGPSTAIGAALGGLLVGLVGGPPNWMK